MGIVVEMTMKVAVNWEKIALIGFTRHVLVIL